MLTSFRRASKSTIGTIVIAFIGLMIVIGFAMGDISNLTPGGGNFSGSTLAKVGSQEITDQEVSNAMQRRLAQVREQNPEATYASIAADFPIILQTLIDDRALQAFADKYGFVISKRLVDAEIAQIPGVRGLNGQVTQQSYQAFLAQQRMTDAELRQLIRGSLLQRLLLTPAASNAHIPIGMATPYASMLLELRRGQVALLPLAAFAEGLNPTDAQIQQFYRANQSRYMVPEQRVLKIAQIGPEQVNVQATAQEIETFYRTNQERFGAKDLRTINQAVVPDRNAANAIAQRARGGQSFAQAAQPAGLTAADLSLGEQTREQFAEVAGEQVAAAVWNAGAGSVVGPVQSDLGWHVVQVESTRTQQGKTLAQASDEIAAEISAQKRETAVADAVDKAQDAIDAGGNFDEAARSAGLSVTTTPAITATGVARGNPSFKFPQQLTPALQAGFELAANDDPVIEQLGEDRQNYALVAPAQVIPAAPAPLTEIRDQVRRDWVRKQAADRALAAARAIAARAGGTASLQEAATQAKVEVPAIQAMSARRLQLTQMGPNVPAPLQTLFTIAQGKAQVGADREGRGYYVVKVQEIVPGNALNQPALISQVQTQFGEPVAQEYAEQIVGAIRKRMGVSRNEEAIAAARSRILGTQ